MTSPLKNDDDVIVGQHTHNKRLYFIIRQNVYHFDELRAIEKVFGGCVLHFVWSEAGMGLFLDKHLALLLWAKISEFLEDESWQ